MFESNTIQKPVGHHAINLTITSVNIKLGTKTQELYCTVNALTQYKLT